MKMKMSTPTAGATDKRHRALFPTPSPSRNRFSEQQQELRGKILTKAEGILTPDQMEVFRKSQEQQAAMEKMGMQMGLKMMGGEKE